MHLDVHIQIHIYMHITGVTRQSDLSYHPSFLDEQSVNWTVPEIPALHWKKSTATVSYFSSLPTFLFKQSVTFGAERGVHMTPFWMIRSPFRVACSRSIINTYAPTRRLRQVDLLRAFLFGFFSAYLMVARCARVWSLIRSFSLSYVVLIPTY